MKQRIGPLGEDRHRFELGENATIANRLDPIQNYSSFQPLPRRPGKM
jgi:hypothetical protein